MLGDLLLVEGRADEAEALYGGLAGGELPATDLLAKRALLAAARGDRVLAIDTWRIVLRLEPRNVRACNNLAWLLLAAPEPDVREALRLATQARTLAPSEPAVLDTAGWAHYHAGNTAEAVELLQAAARKAPYRAVYHFHVGMALARKGDAKGARMALRKAIALDLDARRADQARQALANLGS